MLQMLAGSPRALTVDLHNNPVSCCKLRNGVKMAGEAISGACSPATRRGGSRPTLRSYRSCSSSAGRTRHPLSIADGDPLAQGRVPLPAGSVVYAAAQAASSYPYTTASTAPAAAASTAMTPATADAADMSRTAAAMTATAGAADMSRATAAM